jgi:hypothetical protein
MNQPLKKKRKMQIFNKPGKSQLNQNCETVTSQPSYAKDRLLFRLPLNYTRKNAACVTNRFDAAAEAARGPSEPS